MNFAVWMPTIMTVTILTACAFGWIAGFIAGEVVACGHSTMLTSIKNSPKRLKHWLFDKKQEA